MSQLTVEMMAERRNKPTIFELGCKSITPCPFCGSSDIYFFVEEEWLSIACGVCGATGPARQERLNAIKTWNRRVPTTGVMSK